MKVPPHLWMGAFSRLHPELVIEVQNRMELGARLTLAEVFIRGGGSGSWSEEIARHPSVAAVELLVAGETSGLYRVSYRGDPFVPMLRRLRLMRHFPVFVQNGVASWTVIGRDVKIRELLRTLSRGGFLDSVQSVRPGSLPGPLADLTTRQAELLRRALAAGYFDVPRKVTLSELAREFGLSISTLSVTLAVIERKLMEPHIA